MNIDHLDRITEVKSFLSGTQAVAFEVISGKKERYDWLLRTLAKFRYRQLTKTDKGILIQFMQKISGYSRQQLTRLIKQYVNTGKLHYQQRTSNGFKTKFTASDIRLLAGMDERHQTPNGAAIKKLMNRAYEIYGDVRYKNIAGISISHLYNLRQSKSYLRQRRQFTKTKYKPSSIGERKKPQSYGKPGFLRVDTVHQGDLDGKKGVYHINATDEATQYEVIMSVPKISEQYLIPVLENIFKCFPFNIQGFHSDNGTEYINQRVEKLLKKLFIEFTKSRPRHSNDNALAESKNASVVRKIFGYCHIAQKYAEQINNFNLKYLNPYLNFHRPCFFPTTVLDKKGKERKIYSYENMMTPYEKLKTLPNAETYLRKGLTFEKLDKIMLSQSDNEAADQLNKERIKLFKSINQEDKMAA